MNYNKEADLEVQIYDIIRKLDKQKTRYSTGARLEDIIERVKEYEPEEVREEIYELKENGELMLVFIGEEVLVRRDMRYGQLKLAFEERWKDIRKRSKGYGLTLPSKRGLWRIVIKSWRNGFRCEYCGVQMTVKDSEPPIYSFSIDHKHPINRGGKNSLDNLAVVCTRCNINKGDHPLSEYMQSLEEKYQRELIQKRLDEL